MEATANRHWVRLRPVRTPDWRSLQPLEPPPAADVFRHRVDLTVGVEEETMLLDAATLDLVPAVDDVLHALDDDARFTRELREGQIELLTPVSGSTPAAGVHLAQARLDLRARLPAGMTIAVAGTHPFSSGWGDVAQGARYDLIADEFSAAALGNIACGLHVHVAVDGADRALAVFNAARSYLPEIAALAANSPFADGVDSGLASARRPLTQAFHRSGVPPAFASWDEFDAFVAWGRRGRLFPDPTTFWWDLRPHLRYGTIELRIADAQTRVEDEAAVVAVYHSLVAWLLQRYDSGETLPVHAAARIGENVWRATRYGIRGWMADLDSGDPEPARRRIGALLDRLQPVADALGDGAALLGARTLLADNGTERQRYVAEEVGLRQMTRWLAEQTVSSAADYLARRA